eukprot:7576670-Alexandrium_andersonii.AAC.1
MAESLVEPHVITCSAAVSARERGTQGQAALELQRTMAELRLEPDAIICNAAVSACEERGQWLPALERLRSMAKSHLGAALELPRS